MPDLNQYFDPLAMVQPKNEHDIASILDEVLAELRSVNQHLKDLNKKLEGKP